MQRLAPLLLVVAALAGAPTHASGAAAARPVPRRVAFVLTEGANVIDFAGPWEVFQDAGYQSGDPSLLQLYTVSDSREPVRMTGGLRVVPDYTFRDAPPPDVVVVGAQRGSPAMLAWLRQTSGRTDVVMSVCTGAFKLAAAGLLDGKPATTHHDFYDSFAASYPGVHLVRGRRWVESSPHVLTAGGLTSGIDLALHVVDRMLGRATAEKVATAMEYASDGWRDPTATPVRGSPGLGSPHG